MHQIPATANELSQEIKRLISLIIADDNRLIGLALIYGIGISLLTLSVPTAVQMLINSVVHTTSVTAVMTLAFVLLLLLLVSGLFNAVQAYVMELFERRFYARITSEFTLRIIYADHTYFDRINRYELVNRYFDIMTVQSIIPNLIVGLFALILQMIVGFTLVSFYHPWLFLFNLGIIIVLYLIWRIWGHNAIRTVFPYRRRNMQPPII